MARALALASLLLVPAVATEAGACPGKVVGSSTTPVGKCELVSIAGYQLYHIAECDQEWATNTYYDGKNGGCHGEPHKHSFRVNVCAPAGEKGTTHKSGQPGDFYNNISCTHDSFTITEFNHGVQAPTKVSCAAGVARAGSIVVEATVADHVDLVAFEVSRPGEKSFAGFTAQPDKEGHVVATIPGLPTSTKYEVRARAHQAETSEGNPSTWSSVGEAVAKCSTRKGAPETLEVHSDKKTRWTEVYRVAYGSYPDFLDQHNAGDLNSIFAVMPGTAFRGEAMMTRYCVEHLDVELPGVVTADVSGEPQVSEFADYQTCNHGECLCMNQADRSVARFPASKLLALCGGGYVHPETFNTCKCSAQSIKQSNQYIGRTPIPLPYNIDYSLLAAPIIIPIGYPKPFDTDIPAYWYSLPIGGKCAPWQRPGEGSCTWRRSPIYHTVYAADLDKMGLNHSTIDTLNFITKQPSHSEIDYAASKQNIEIGRKAFEKLNMPPCGSVPVLAESERRLAGTRPTPVELAAAVGIFV